MSFLVSLATGFVLEKIFHKKWWDYSRKKFQFGGYVNLPYTVVWGITAVVCVCFVNPFLGKMIGMIPRRIGEIILIVLYIVLAIDFAGTVASFAAVNKRIRKLAIISSVSENLQKAADEMGKGLVGWTLKYVSRAYPDLEAKKLLEARQEQERQAEKAKEKAGVFAVGCSFYKLVCLFFIGAFLGDIIETIFCWITMGRLMSRSGVRGFQHCVGTWLCASDSNPLPVQKQKQGLYFHFRYRGRRCLRVCMQRFHRDCIWYGFLGLQQDSV